MIGYTNQIMRNDAKLMVEDPITFNTLFVSLINL